MAEDAHRIRHKLLEAIGPEAYHIRWQHTGPHIHDGEDRRKDPRGSRHEQVVDNHRWVDERREVEAANGSCCGGSSTHRGVGNGDGIHRDEGCNHGREAGLGRSSRQTVDSRLGEMVGANESGSGRCEEPRLGSVHWVIRGAGSK